MKEEIHTGETANSEATTELRAREVRLFKENRTDYPSDSAAYASAVEKLGCSRVPLREW